MAPQHLRMRILADLSSLLNQNDKSVQINTPGMLITLVQGLFSLLASMAFLAAKSPEMKLIQELISNIQYGQCGEMTKESIEVEFKATLTDDDEEGDVRDALVIVGLGKFLEHGAESSRRWLLRYSTEVRNMYLSYTSPYQCLVLAILGTTCGVFHTSSDSDSYPQDLHIQSWSS